MKNNIRRHASFAGVWLSVLVGVMAFVCLGCSKKAEEAAPPPDFQVQVQDAQGLGAGAPAQWRGMDVGRVETVAMDKGVVRIDVRLHDAYRAQFREGLRARPTRGFMGRGAVVLELYGGSDAQKPVLSPGALIPEASLRDSITPGQLKSIAILASAVIIFLVVLGLVRKLAALVLALVFLAFAGWFVLRQWQRHGDDVLAARTEMQWSDLARSILTEEAAQEAWATAQADLASAAGEFGDMGKERIAKEAADLREKMERKAESLAAEGKDLAAEEVRKFQDAILRTSQETTGK